MTTTSALGRALTNRTDSMAAKPKKPGKLFNLKEWLTLEDAAKHLSTLFDEDVTVADVLRLALDRRLTLSVWFVNHTQAKKGRLVPLAECKLRLLPSLEAISPKIKLPEKRVLTREELSNLEPTIKAQLDARELFVTPNAIHYSDNDEWLVQEDEIVSISGIWDLPMVGGESLDVEHRFQMETDGPAITLTNMEGAFVVRDGVVCQLQENFDNNPYQAGSEASLKALEERIAVDGMSKAEAEVLREKHRKLRAEFRKQPPSYYPAGGLPEDAVWVVRTAALREFERDVAGPEAGRDKPLSSREETTLLNLVGGLLGLLLGTTPSGKSQSVFKDQAAVIEALLASYPGKPGIAKRTLEAKLAEAKRSLSSS